MINYKGCQIEGEFNIDIFDYPRNVLPNVIIDEFFIEVEQYYKQYPKDFSTSSSFKSMEFLYLETRSTMEEEVRIKLKVILDNIINKYTKLL